MQIRYSSFLIIFIVLSFLGSCDNVGPTGQDEIKSKPVATGTKSLADQRTDLNQREILADSLVSMQSDCNDGDETVIIPCDDNSNPPEPLPSRYTVRVNTPMVNVSVIKDLEDPAITDINWTFHSLLSGMKTEIEYALRDVQFDDIPLGGGHENEFNPLPLFDMNLVGRFKTDVNSGKINVALTLYDFELDARIESTKWYTSDAVIEATIDQVIVKERFNIATGQFETV